MTVRQWLTFVGPWLLAAVAGGLLYGLAGWHWGRTRSVVAGVALGLPFVVEPLLWALFHGYVQTPWLLWLAEVILGLALIASTWVFSSGHARREGLTRNRKPGVGRSG
jgi:MFS family permease